VYLDALDLIVFCADRKAQTDLGIDKFDTDLISAFWEMRYNNLCKHHEKKNKRVKALLSKIDNKFDKLTQQQVLNYAGCKLASFCNLGKTIVYSTDKFEFTIKSVVRRKK
jgi:hypothetical protein